MVASRAPVALRGLRGSFPVSAEHPLPALISQMQHLHQIYFCQFFFFLIIGIISCSRCLPVTRPTVQNFKRVDIKPCKGKPALPLILTSLFYRCKKKTQKKKSKHNHPPSPTHLMPNQAEKTIPHPLSTHSKYSNLSHAAAKAACSTADPRLLPALTASPREAFSLGHSLG